MTTSSSRICLATSCRFPIACNLCGSRDFLLRYRLTKPFKLGGSYNGEGVLNFVLTECNTEDSDNIELHIANYYDHFPKEKPDEPDTPSGDDTPDVPDGKKVWF